MVEREDSRIRASLNIAAICFHGSEGYLGLHVLSIVVVIWVLPRCSLYPTGNPPRTCVIIRCPATTQSFHKLSVKLWPSSALLWRLSSAIRGLGKSIAEETISNCRGQGISVVLLLSASNWASGYKLLVVVQLRSPSRVQLESAFIAIEVLPELYVKDNALM